MLRLFSYPKSTVPQTRFESCEELKEITPLLNELRKKKNELAATLMKKGEDSLDYQKHRILNNIIADIDQLIEEFNQEVVPAVRDDQFISIYTLVDALLSKVKTTVKDHGQLLGEFRDKDKLYAQLGLCGGYIVTAGTILYSAPIFLLAKIGLWFIGERIILGNFFRQFGLDETKAKSFVVLVKLYLVLLSKHQHLEHVLGIEPPVSEPLSQSQNDDSESQHEDNSGLLFTLSDITQSYVDSMSGRRKNSEILEDLQLTEDEEALFDDYKDPIILCVPNIPVTINEHLYDFEALIQLPPDADGQLEEPLTKFKFYPRDIQPAREVVKKIQGIIEQIKQHREEQQQALSASSSPRR